MPFWASIGNAQLPRHCLERLGSVGASWRRLSGPEHLNRHRYHRHTWNRYSHNFSMEGLQLVSLHRRFVFMQVSKWILRAIMMSVVVCVDGLGFQTRDRIELLDGRGTQSCQRTEHCTLDLCNLGIFDSVYEGVLGACSVVLQLLRCVLLPEWCDLVEIHLQVMSHFLRQLVLGRHHHGDGQAEQKRDAGGKLHRNRHWCGNG